MVCFMHVTLPQKNKVQSYVKAIIASYVVLTIVCTVVLGLMAGVLHVSVRAFCQVSSLLRRATLLLSLMKCSRDFHPEKY